METQQIEQNSDVTKVASAPSSKRPKAKRRPPPHRPSKQQLHARRLERRKRQLELRRAQAIEGLFPRDAPALPNTRSTYASVEEERQAREQAVCNQLNILRRELPWLLKHLDGIRDIRQMSKCRYPLAAILLYGLLMFVLQFGSRREVNREMTRPQFEENLRMLFPELETLPHADTLYRLLCNIDVAELEEIHIGWINKLIRRKKFRRYLIGGYYPIAIDGSQKFTRNTLWDDQPLQRTVGSGEASNTQYFVYVLEASLSFRNGLVIPLLSEFLEYDKGDKEYDKQDCELRAFTRLSARIKKLFPYLQIVLLLDGLYANGPLMERCHALRWQYMIVLKDNCLRSVWEEFESLLKLSPANQFRLSWGNRRQRFTWVNNIDYEYTPAGGCPRIIKVHVVVCEETWEVIGTQNEIVTKTSRHAWLSSVPLTRRNLHERCNLGARYRWGIEAGFLVEKHQGYNYEHAFAYDWNAMRGYHVLMRMGHMINVLARFSRRLKSLYAKYGVRGSIAFIRQTLAAPWLDSKRVAAILNKPWCLQLE